MRWILSSAEDRNVLGASNENLSGLDIDFNGEMSVPSQFENFDLESDLDFSLVCKNIIVCSIIL